MRTAPHPPHPPSPKSTHLFHHSAEHGGLPPQSPPPKPTHLFDDAAEHSGLAKGARPRLGEGEHYALVEGRGFVKRLFERLPAAGPAASSVLVPMGGTRKGLGKDTQVASGKDKDGASPTKTERTSERTRRAPVGRQRNGRGRRQGEDMQGANMLCGGCTTASAVAQQPLRGAHQPLQEPLQQPQRGAQCE